MCERLGIQRRLSTAYHPQTDGATERANQELEAYLRIFISFEQKDWAQLLPVAMIALNNRTNTLIRVSPFFMTHGYYGALVEREEDEDRSLGAQAGSLLEEEEEEEGEKLVGGRPKPYRQEKSTQEGANNAGLASSPA